MIGFVFELILEQILEPQAAVADPELRVVLDRESAPIDANAQEFDALEGTTRPVGYEIGGAVELAHTITVALDVQHGDITVARSLRDRILVDLVMRSRSARDQILGAVDEATGQTVESFEWTSVDYRPLGFSDTNSSASIVFSVTTRLDG